MLVHTCKRTRQTCSKDVRRNLCSLGGEMDHEYFLREAKYKRDSVEKRFCIIMLPKQVVTRNKKEKITTILESASVADLNLHKA